MITAALQLKANNNSNPIRSSDERRLTLMNKQKASIERQIDELSNVHRVLEFKEWYYETARKEGSTSIPRDMRSDELPEEFREIRKMLRGE